VECPKPHRRSRGLLGLLPLSAGGIVLRVIHSKVPVDVPVVQAPMAGGPSTPALAAAVSDVGGLGFVAAGYRRPEDVLTDIAATRGLTGRPFGVNVFAPPSGPADPRTVDRYARRLRSQAAALGVTLGQPRFDQDHYQEKVDLLVREQVAVVSFTFGCPTPSTVQRLQRSGASVWVTVTDPEEASKATAVGADALVVQGVEAGGHRGSFLDSDEHEDYGLLALLSLVSARVDLPLIAAGGIATGAALAAVLAAGAAAGALGTAFLRCPESGTTPMHRDVVPQSRRTGLTRAFTGRLDRSLINTFHTEHTASAPIAYPEVHHLTAPLRAKAREIGDIDLVHLWAGQAHELAEAMPAGQLVIEIIRDATAALERARQRLQHTEVCQESGSSP
jgi:nitronate monooxygenase